MIKISKSNGIFSKLRNAFIGSEPNPITDDNFELDNAISSSSIGDDTFIASSIEEPILSDTELSPDNLSVSDVHDSNASLVENYDVASTKDNTSPCWSVLDTGSNSYYTTGKRKILFKIEKYKFDYPVSKTTTLYYYPNLPIIQSLEFTTKTKHDSSHTTTILCDNVQVTIPIEYDYEEITFKPYVSYSVALYNQKTPCLLEPTNPPTCDLDINNLDIYALENDSLFLTPFTMCFPVPAKDFSPSDFIVTVSVIDPLGGTVSPVCEFDSYYLYEVEVDIKLTLAPVIDLSSIDISTLNVLNVALDKPIGNTLFTECELESITDIDFSNLNTSNYSASSLSGLDYNIFNYLPNLIKLNISNTNANVNTASNFELLNALKKLTILIAENNNFTDYSAFSLLTNFISTLTSLNLRNIQILDNDARILAVPGDISPLTIFTSLTSLDLSSNNLTYLPASIIALSNLTNLILSNNNLTSLPVEFSALSNLVYLDLSKNSISDLSVLSDFNNLETLNISENPVNPNTINNLPVTNLDYSNNNLDNQSILSLELSSKLQNLNISGNHISDLTPLSKYSINVIAINQIIDYGQLQASGIEICYLDLETFLLDIDGYVPCIDYISDGGTCSPVESCDCMGITWPGVNHNINAYFTFSNITDTFTGKVTVELVPLPV